MQIIDTDKLGIKKSNNNISNNQIYDTEEILKILYDNLPSICDMQHDKVIDSSKYVRIARDYQYRNYKFCTYNDIIQLGLENSLYNYLKRFIAEEGAVVMIFGTLNNVPISATLRKLNKKEFCNYSSYYTLYGFDLINDNFKYGDCLLIAEGFYDADSIRPLFKNSVATMTSNVNRLQSHILLSMTDKFIIAYDSDKAGNNGFKKARERLKNVVQLQVYKGDKDLGVMEELKDNKKEYEKRVRYYKEQLQECAW